MKTFLQSAGPLILAVLVCIAMYIFTREKDISFDGIEKENTLLRHQADSLIRANGELDKKLQNYQVSLDSIRRAISVKDQKIKNLKKSEHEKLISVDSLTSNELYNLFSGFTP